MQFDDRLATVLRSRAVSEQAARAQFRQLLDLLGSASEAPDRPLVKQAYARLAELEHALPAIEQAHIIREPGLRLRNLWLLSHLAERDPQPAAAALATARLGEDQWLILIPELTVTARGFLRHRRDLPETVSALLAKLGVGDLVLPKPEPLPAGAVEAETSGAGASISAVARRIEAFRRSRRIVSDEIRPMVPAGDSAPTPRRNEAGSCDFSTDAQGRVDWAEEGFDAVLVGLLLASEYRVDPDTISALRHHQPIEGARVMLDGVAKIAGEWRLDATPHFTKSGAFAGHFGRLRRSVTGKPAIERRSGQSDRMRQALHEMRTPLGAIQGFAELIQHQMFGSVPNAYRALAGAIAVDAARMLAGFEEIERMVKLQAEGLEPSSDPVNMRLVVERTLKRLEGVLRPQSSGICLQVSGESFDVALGHDDAALLTWRLLATLAGALAPGEVIDLGLRTDGDRLALAAEMPIAWAQSDDPFAPAPPAKAPVVSAGMFGTGFTLRLARAEAEAAGGSLVAEEDLLMIELPLLN
jgi:two-component system OmpR family sensor kinase